MTLNLFFLWGVDFYFISENPIASSKGIIKLSYENMATSTVLKNSMTYKQPHRGARGDNGPSPLWVLAVLHDFEKILPLVNST